MGVSRSSITNNSTPHGTSASPTRRRAIGPDAAFGNVDGPTAAWENKARNTGDGVLVHEEDDDDEEVLLSANNAPRPDVNNVEGGVITEIGARAMHRQQSLIGQLPDSAWQSPRRPATTGGAAPPLRTFRTRVRASVRARNR
eukprot:scaffold173537_cov39-Prasinocladus_malaysianus.AAC.1